MSVRAESNLGLGRCRPSSFIRGAFAALVIAATSSAWGAEDLRPGLPPQDTTGRLLESARNGDLLLVKEAVARGADVSCQGTNGLTPLLQTVSGAVRPLDSRQRECVAFLLERGADVDAKDRDGRTALMYATRVGDLETVRLLVKAGAFILERDRFHKTALLYAADGHREILIYLGQTLKAERGAAW
jgi:ankyrin repeat protein